MFTGHSCLLITWKTNPEVEQFKELYMENSVKTHKRKNKQLVDPGDLVSPTPTYNPPGGFLLLLLILILQINCF